MTARVNAQDRGVLILCDRERVSMYRLDTPRDMAMLARMWRAGQLSGVSDTLMRDVYWFAMPNGDVVRAMPRPVLDRFDAAGHAAMAVDFTTAQHGVVASVSWREDGRA